MKREIATNAFKDGMSMDFHPTAQLDYTYTNALNATLLTMNGNELSLQNDMGNVRVEGCELPSGYVPLGTCEYGGIIYIVSYNPLTNKTLIGSFPSPIFSSSDEIENTTEVLLSYFILECELPYLENKDLERVRIDFNDNIQLYNLERDSIINELSKVFLYYGDEFNVNIADNLEDVSELYIFNDRSVDITSSIAYLLKSGDIVDSNKCFNIKNNYQLNKPGSLSLKSTINVAPNYSILCYPVDVNDEESSRLYTWHNVEYEIQSNYSMLIVYDYKNVVYALYVPQGESMVGSLKNTNDSTITFDPILHSVKFIPIIEINEPNGFILLNDYAKNFNIDTSLSELASVKINDYLYTTDLSIAENSDAIFKIELISLSFNANRYSNTQLEILPLSEFDITYKDELSFIDYDIYGKPKLNNFFDNEVTNKDGYQRFEFTFNKNTTINIPLNSLGIHDVYLVRISTVLTKINGKSVKLNYYRLFFTTGIFNLHYISNNIFDFKNLTLTDGLNISPLDNTTIEPTFGEPTAWNIYINGTNIIQNEKLYEYPDLSYEIRKYINLEELSPVIFKHTSLIGRGASPFIRNIFPGVHIEYTITNHNSQENTNKITSGTIYPSSAYALTYDTESDLTLSSLDLIRSDSACSIPIKMTITHDLVYECTWNHVLQKFDIDTYEVKCHVLEHSGEVIEGLSPSQDQVGEFPELSEDPLYKFNFSTVEGNTPFNGYLNLHTVKLTKPAFITLELTKTRGPLSALSLGDLNTEGSLPELKFGSLICTNKTSYFVIPTTTSDNSAENNYIVNAVIKMLKYDIANNNEIFNTWLSLNLGLYINNKLYMRRPTDTYSLYTRLSITNEYTLSMQLNISVTFDHLGFSSVLLNFLKSLGMIKNLQLSKTITLPTSEITLNLEYAEPSFYQKPIKTTNNNMISYSYREAFNVTSDINGNNDAIVYTHDKNQAIVRVVDRELTDRNGIDLATDWYYTIANNLSMFAKNIFINSDGEMLFKGVPDGMIVKLLPHDPSLPGEDNKAYAIFKGRSRF